MTNKEAINILSRPKTMKNTPSDILEAHEMAIKALGQEPNEDCIARQPLIDNWNSCADMLMNEGDSEVVMEWVFDAPSVTPAHKKGQWLRMSDLSEQEDDRYQCSRCRNVVHYKDKMDLYTFNGWCGRCGSSNRREIEVEL